MLCVSTLRLCILFWTSTLSSPLSGTIPVTHSLSGTRTGLYNYALWPLESVLSYFPPPLFFKPSEKLLQMISDDSVFLFPPLTTEEVAHSSLLIPSDVQLAKGCSLRCEAGCTGLTANTHTCLKCKQRRLQVQTCERGTSLVFWGIFTPHYGNNVQTCCNRMAFFNSMCCFFFLWQTLLKVISLPMPNFSTYYWI